MAKAWEGFTIGRANAGAGVAGWSSLTTVKHTTHLRSAIRIAEDSTLSAQLINDGVLEKTRTKVVYFSPNYWNDGSRYGSFEFSVNWDDLLSDRKLYWADEFHSPKYPIYRFLLSNKDVSGLPVVPYDPSADNGPIKLVAGDWFWATEYGAEIVVDDDLPLYEVTSVQFGKHHDSFCSLRNASCPERGYPRSNQAMQAFMGVLLGRGLHSLDSLLTENGKPTAECHRALSNTYPLLIMAPEYGGTISAPNLAQDVVQAALLMIQNGDRAAVIRLMSLISDKETAEAAYVSLICQHFSLSKFDWD